MTRTSPLQYQIGFTENAERMGAPALYQQQGNPAQVLP
jgi:hypothetical protein